LECPAVPVDMLVYLSDYPLQAQANNKKKWPVQSN